MDIIISELCVFMMRHLIQDRVVTLMKKENKENVN